jgi:CheY-like chemotaxis protein
MDSRTCTTILVVQGEEALRKSTADSLRGEGFHVYEVCSVARAIELLRSIPRPALILADLLMMPAANPDALVAELGPGDRFAILPVVISGEGHGSHERCKRPIPFGDLVGIVERACFRRL